MLIWRIACLLAVSIGAVLPVRLDRVSAPTCVGLAATFLTLQGAALFALGRPFICACGYVSFWYGNPSGPETSQHLTDWYTYTHLLHGFLFYLLLWLVAPKAPLMLKLAIVFGIEGLWEIAENTPFIVDRYRQSALALGYSGDSIVNSVSDSLATALGFVLARLLPVRASIAAVVGIELFLGYMIHDNLTLNVIHLIRPDAAIRGPADGIRIAGRATQGAIVFDTAQGARVVSVERLFEESEDVNGEG